METTFPAYQGEDAYIFVCYAHEDLRSVLSELERLRDLGFNVWYDEGISLGHAWTDEIANAILGATEFIYFVSVASVASRNCRNELQFAASRSKKIIAVYLEPTELPGGVELAIGLTQAIHRYDVTDETFVRKLTNDLTAPMPNTQPPAIAEANTGKKYKKALLGISTAIVFLCLFVGLWFLRGQEDPTPTPLISAEVLEMPSIAVLPFDNLSSDSEQAFFSNGVAEEVLNQLATSSGIKVISRSSSFSFFDKKMSLPEIANRLGVSHILQGSVRKSGSAVRVAVQLVEVETDSYIWSNTYDREIDDIFVTQDEIAAAVSGALNVVFDRPNARVLPEDAEAYSLYLRARHTLGIGGTVDDLKVAEGQLKEALRLAPDYVAAWRELGRVYLQQVGKGMISGEESTRLRWDAVSQALAIDPDDAVANAYRGYQEMVVNDNLIAAAESFDKAVRLAPRHEDVLRPLMLFMLELDLVEEALPFAKLAVERDPLCGVCILHLGRLYSMLGRLDEAEQQFLAAATVLQDPYDATTLRAMLELQKGQADSALVLFSELSDTNPRRYAGEAVALYKLGRIVEFDSAVAYLGSSWPDEFFLLASVYAQIGEPEQAFIWLEKGVAMNPVHRRSVSGMPRPAAWLPYKNDPRWQAFLESINRSPERLRAIVFNPRFPLQN